jgi:hypothetical protein
MPRLKRVNSPAVGAHNTLCLSHTAGSRVGPVIGGAWKASLCCSVGRWTSAGASAHQGSLTVSQEMTSPPTPSMTEETVLGMMFLKRCPDETSVPKWGEPSAATHLTLRSFKLIRLLEVPSMSH